MWGARKADAYLLALHDQVHDIASSEMLADRYCGVITDHPDATSLCFRIVGRHYIIYRVAADDAIVVLTLFHVSQDMEQAFAELIGPSQE